MKWERIGPFSPGNSYVHFAKSTANNWKDATRDISKFWLKLCDIIRDEPALRGAASPWNCLMLSADIANFKILGQIGMRKAWPIGLEGSKDVWNTCAEISVWYIDQRDHELGLPTGAPTNTLDQLRSWARKAFPAIIGVTEETKSAVVKAVTADVLARLKAIYRAHPFAVYWMEYQDKRTIKRLKLPLTGRG